MQVKLIHLLITLIFSAQCYSQENKSVIPISSIAPTESYNDLQLLDQWITNRRIIGVGESTHGTSEFTTMRLRLFKYLVENHGYTVFFLEADYNACQRINRYIHGSSDSVAFALHEVRLWPWITQEMVDLIEWCKIYNETANAPIEFVGCDMQLIQDDKIELLRFFDGKENESQAIQQIFGDTKALTKDSLQKVSAREKWLEFNKKVNLVSYPIEHQLHFEFTKKTIDQWFEHYIERPVDYNFRDSCMAINMLNYLAQFPEKKAFYFAHNGHVSKYHQSYNDGKSFVNRTGWYLHDSLGEQYLALAQLTSLGTFNAFTLEKKEFKMIVHELKKPKKKSIEYFFSSFNTPLLFYPASSLTYGTNLKYTSIGAVYGKYNEDSKFTRYRKLETGWFDGFIYIQNTTKSTLLDKF